MKRAVRRVADVLGVYARLQGWWPLDFRLYFRVNGAWGKIHVNFVSDGFEGRDKFDCYQSILAFLKTRTADDPDLADAVGLVVSTFKQVEQGGLYAIGDEYTFVRPRDLVKLTARATTGVIAGFVKSQGWDALDYKPFRKTDSDQGLVQVVILARRLDDRDDADLSGAVQGYARSRLAEEPEILNTLDIKIETVEDIDEEATRRLNQAGYKDAWELHEVRPPT